MKTVFCDIDGCILNHPSNFNNLYNTDNLDTVGFGVEIAGSVAKILEWWCNGVRVILTTGRPESEYERLAAYLSRLGVYYHKLIMDCGSGIRYLINDYPAESGFTYHPKAVAINLLRNQGLAKVELD